MKCVSKYFPLYLLLVMVLFVVGCGPKLPADLPKRYPCTLTVRQDDKPLEGASVILFSSDPAISKWAASGVTDAGGIVQMKTQGKYDGVVAGEYKVLLTKVIVEKGTVLKEETATSAEESKPGKTYSYIEKKFGDPANSPLVLKVVDKKIVEELNVGKSVKEEVFSN